MTCGTCEELAKMHIHKEFVCERDVNVADHHVWDAAFSCSMSDVIFEAWMAIQLATIGL